MILLTGAAGFIGFHVAQALLARGDHVIGIDSLNDYYDPKLKVARLKQLEAHQNFTFHHANIADAPRIMGIIGSHPDIDVMIHLAAQAGVRYSLENAFAYSESNLMGQTVMLEAARHLKNLRHCIYASSSSVYGNTSQVPYREDDRCDQPVSLYAATKRACELLSYSYAQLYKIPLTGLRFFTVYGPWGRPDMAYFSFTKAIIEGQPIKVFNHGNLKRDFTYIDDIVNGVLRSLEAPPGDDVPHRLFNLGNHRPVPLGDFIGLIEHAVGKRAIRENAPMAPGDVYETFADISAAQEILGYDPKTSLESGIPRFVAWYKGYYEC